MVRSTHWNFVPFLYFSPIFDNSHIFILELTRKVSIKFFSPHILITLAGSSPQAQHEDRYNDRICDEAKKLSASLAGDHYGLAFEIFVVICQNFIPLNVTSFVARPGQL